MKKTRKELMQQLNSLLNTDNNWRRLSLLDLERLVLAIQKLTAKMYVDSGVRTRYDGGPFI